MAAISVGKTLSDSPSVCTQKGLVNNPRVRKGAQMQRQYPRPEAWSHTEQLDLGDQQSDYRVLVHLLVILLVGYWKR